MKAANSTSDNYDDNHLSEAQMIAYCRGEVSVVEREAAQVHLVECGQCIALFRNARDFIEPARDDEVEIGEAEINQAWQSLWARAQTEAQPNVEADVAPTDFQQPHARKPFDWRTAWWRPALAFAVLALIAAGLFYLFGGKPGNKPPEIVQEESPAPGAPPVAQPPTTAQDGSTSSPNPTQQGPPAAGEEVLAMNIKAQPGTSFEDSATRGEREDAARASLLTAQKIVLEVGGDKRSRNLLSRRLTERLRASGRFAPTGDRAEAEVALKIAVETAPRAPIDPTADQRVSFSARVVGADGKTLWPLTPRTIARRYRGQARSAVDRLISDLLEDIRRLERKGR